MRCPHSSSPTCGAVDFYADLSHPTAISAIQRHSTTLREINLGRFKGFFRVSFAIIVENCINLNGLSIDTYELGEYIDLAQTQGLPWCCTKLHNLTLGICGCELPPVDAESLLYYDRPAPIVLSQAEAEHFTRLERLYMQIGRLTELRHLDITMIQLNGRGEVDGHRRSIPMSFPAMLTRKHLGRSTGIFEALSGLTKLETLLGSVRADTEETRTTMDWKEATWMDEHWPKLKYAHFFGIKDIRASFL